MSNTGLLTLKVNMIIYGEVPEEWSCVTSLRASITSPRKSIHDKILKYNPFPTQNSVLALDEPVLTWKEGQTKDHIVPNPTLIDSN